MSERASKHSDCSPSALGSLVPGRCPGRMRMERDVPEVDTGGAKFGIRAHAELARLLLEDEPDTSGIEHPELRFLVGRAVEFARRKGFLSGSRYTERQVRVTDPSGEELTRGTVDLCRRSGDVAEAIDWKFHHVPVDRVDSVMQLAGYLLGLMEEWGLTRARGWVYLPRLDLEYFWETDLEEAQELVGRTIREAEKPDAPLRAGTWCRYCKALTTCPEVRERGREFLGAFRIPREVREASQVKIREHARGELDRWIKAGALEKVEALSEMLPVLEPALASVRATIRALLAEGKAGALAKTWELRERRGRRRANALDLWPLVSGTVSREEFADSVDLRWERLEEHYVDRLVREAQGRGEDLPRDVARGMFERQVARHTVQPIHTELRRKRG